MTDVETLAFEAELEAARERQRTTERAADADRLEMDLAFERVGIPGNTLGRTFRSRLYEGPADEVEIRLAWAALLDRDDFLDAGERFQAELRRARAAMEET